MSFALGRASEFYIRVSCRAKGTSAEVLEMLGKSLRLNQSASLAPSNFCIFLTKRAHIDWILSLPRSGIK